MGSDHARILASQVPGARVQALFDADPTRAKAIADETGARVVTADPAALIQDSTVDAVLVASPDHTHKQLVLACIAARKPVLCEKPLAPTVAECLEVVAVESKLGRRLSVSAASGKTGRSWCTGVSRPRDLEGPAGER